MDLKHNLIEGVTTFLIKYFQATDKLKDQLSWAWESIIDWALTIILVGMYS